MAQFRKRKSDGQSFPVNNGSKLRANNPSNQVGGVRIGKGIKNFVAVKDEDGEIDIFDKVNMDKIDDIVEEEAERRVVDFSLDDYEEFLNSFEPPVEALGSSQSAGTFLRENDIVAFRTGKNDYADSQSEEFEREARSEIDQFESLKLNKFVKE